MIKKILLLFILLIIPMNVDAAAVFDKVVFASAFDQSIDLDNIGKIVIEMEIVPFDTTKTPFKQSITLTKENNFKKEELNRVTSGNINVIFVLVGDDFASIKYDTKIATNVNQEENNAFVQLVVTPRNVKTSSTADKTVLEDIMKEHFLDEETKNMLDYIPPEIINSTTATTTTTTTENGTIVIGQDKTTTNTITTEKTTSKKEDIDKEKEEIKKKEDFLFKLIIYVVLGTLIIGGIFVAIKIYAASKLT